MIVVDVPNAMVVAVSYENFDVILFLIKVAADTAGLVQGSLESLLVFQSGFAVSQPRKYLVVERIYHFDLVVVRVSHSYHVFVRDEANAQRVLKLR